VILVLPDRFPLAFSSLLWDYPTPTHPSKLSLGIFSRKFKFIARKANLLFYSSGGQKSETVSQGRIKVSARLCSSWKISEESVSPSPALEVGCTPC
jgi:hypothetical protein